MPTFIPITSIYECFKQFPAICTDSRKILPHSIFFALSGSNFDGNQFAEGALQNGCKYAVVDKPEYCKDKRFLLVPDVLKSLQDLAIMHRKQFTIPVIGITGTNGKTTTKELITAVLRKKYNLISTQGNLNNHIGVPLTVLQIQHSTEIAIVEMGANHIGEIAQLCSIAQPTHGIITNIGKAHLEGFGSYEGVIKAKNELYQYIQFSNGQLFVNNNDSLLMQLSENVKRITYGYKPDGDMVFQFLPAHPYATIQAITQTLQNKVMLQSKLVGNYNNTNIAAAATIGNFFKVNINDIEEAVSNYTPTNNRSQIIKTKTNEIILDAYNANPSSMMVALDNFFQMTHSKKIAILGDMLELGEKSKQEHIAIVEQILKNNIESIILVGPVFSEIAASRGIKNFLTSEEAKNYIQQHPIENALILIKGSRGIKMEIIADVL